MWRGEESDSEDSCLLWEDSGSSIWGVAQEYFRARLFLVLRRVKPELD